MFWALNTTGITLCNGEVKCLTPSRKYRMSKWVKTLLSPNTHNCQDRTKFLTQIFRLLTERDSFLQRAEGGWVKVWCGIYIPLYTSVLSLWKMKPWILHCSSDGGPNLLNLTFPFLWVEATESCHYWKFVVWTMGFGIPGVVGQWNHGALRHSGTTWIAQLSWMWYLVSWS